MSALCALALGQSNDRSADILRFFYSKAADRTIGTRIETDYRTTPARFLNLAERVTRRTIAPDFDYVPNVSVATRAKSIQTAVLEAVRQSEPGANDLLKERMVVQGLYDWTRTHLPYNLHLADTSIELKFRQPYKFPENLFKMDHPSCVCPGYARTFEAMAMALGIEAFQVDGVTRGSFVKALPATAKQAIHHSWDMVRQHDGFLLPVDSTNSAVGLEKARELNGRISQPVTLPSLPEDWALQFAVYFAIERPTRQGKPLLKSEDPLGMTYDEWRMVDVRPLKNEYKHKVGMTWFDTATVNWPISQ